MLKHIIICSLSLSAVVGHAAEPIVRRVKVLGPTPQQKQANLNQAIAASPMGKYLAGERRSGIYNFNDSKVCNRWALQSIYANQEKPVAVRLLDDNGPIWDEREGPKDIGRAGSMIRLWVDTMNDAQNMLIRNGDLNAMSHHVCIGFGKFAAPNAESMGAGYITFDPQILLDTNHNPNRSAYSMDAIAMHEFAHQLQYWTDEPTLNDVLVATGKPYARRAELSADCAAAALLGALNIPKIGRFWQIEKSGVSAAIKAVGDYEILSGNHHGTPRERELAVNFGLNLAEKTSSRGLGLKGFTSRYILNSCRAFIDRMDSHYGNPWPIWAVLR